MGAALSPLLLDHPAICETSLRAGETIALVYNYATTHTKFIICCIVLMCFTYFHKLAKHCPVRVRVRLSSVSDSESDTCSDTDSDLGS